LSCWSFWFWSFGVLVIFVLVIWSSGHLVIAVLVIVVLVIWSSGHRRAGHRRPLSLHQGHIDAPARLLAVSSHATYLPIDRGQGLRTQPGQGQGQIIGSSETVNYGPQ